LRCRARRVSNTSNAGDQGQITKLGPKAYLPGSNGFRGLLIHHRLGEGFALAVNQRASTVGALTLPNRSTALTATASGWPATLMLLDPEEATLAIRHWLP
jgi:hypothetical protein